VAAILAAGAYGVRHGRGDAVEYFSKVVVCLIPKLYTSDRVTLLCWLADVTICEVTEERNGVYELYMEIPIASEQYPMIENDRFIKAKSSENAADQLFRVYGVEKSMTGWTVVKGEHISYLLAAYPVQSVQTLGLSCQQAMNAVLAAANEALTAPHGFTAWTDNTAVANYAVSAVSARAAFGGVRGSVLDVYGGEYEFDNKVVRLHQARGRDNGVTIAYAKNLYALKASISTEGTYTGLYPFATLEEGLNITLPEKVLQVPHPVGIAERIFMKDFTQELERQSITVTALRNVANTWLNANNLGAPDISLEVDFVHLWQSPEYAEFADLERVSLCDTVTIRHPDLGVDVSAKVIKTVYDTLKEKYKTITVGSAKSNMGSTLAAIKEEIRVLGVETTTAIEQTANAIMMAVASQYASGDYLATYIRQLSDSVDFRFFSTRQEIDALTGELTGNQSLLEEYIRFQGALIELGRVGNAFTAQLDNSRLAFLENGSPIAYVSNQKLWITDAQILNQLRIGKWMWTSQSNDNLILAWVGSA
jgi:phage minor structural protein